MKNLILATLLSITQLPGPVQQVVNSPFPVTVKLFTTSPAADAGGGNLILENNSQGPMTFNLPGWSSGLQRCYRNYTGNTGPITIAVPTGNVIDYNGANGLKGTFISTGTVIDYACLIADTSNHWSVWGASGTWVNP